MENHKCPADDLPAKLQALLQYRKESPNPSSILPPDHHGFAQPQVAPVFGGSDRYRLERDEFRSLYVDANRELERTQQILNQTTHQLNVQNHQIQNLQAELQTVSMRYEGKVCDLSIFHLPYLLILFLFSALKQQHDSLRVAGTFAANGVNARGITLPDRLRDIRARVQEIALHGIRKGAAIAFASAQVRSGHELRQLPPRNPSHCAGISILLNDFADEASIEVLYVNPREVINKIFDPQISN